MRAFMSAISFAICWMMASWSVGTAVGVEVEVVFVAPAAAGSDVALAVTPPLVPGAPDEGGSSKAVCTGVGVFAGCCAEAVIGAKPKHSTAVAGTAFQILILIQPLTLMKNFGHGYEYGSLGKLQRRTATSTSAPQVVLLGQECGSVVRNGEELGPCYPSKFISSVL
jgi:hypothetical protein